MMAVGAVAFVVMIAAWAVFFLALNPQRRRTRKPGPVVPIVEEAADGVTLAPWSPTRGFYWFAASDLPAEYLGLAGVHEGVSFKQNGDDEADALAQLNARLAKRYFDETRRVAPPISAKPIRFQALNKRKKDRTP